MIFKQYYLKCLSQASYLIGDEDTKSAAVIDPQRDIDQYVEDCERYGLKIRHVFLTHFHADFVAGHIELMERFSATIYLGAKAEAEFEFIPLTDGDMLEIGNVYLEVMETPGHSPESICILVYDNTRDANKPYAVLTGDTLFIGDVGRPDLRASLGWTAEELGGMLYDSLHGKLLELPDDTLVFPTHGAGSLCGKQLSEDSVSNIGDQKKYNYALQLMSKEKFIEIVTVNQPDPPDYFTYDAILNTKKRLTLHETVRRNLTPLTLERVLDLKDEGAQILDVRNPVDYSRIHLYGSINIGLGGNFASWAGTLLDSNKPIVIVAFAGTEEEAIIRLGRIGYDNIAGYLEGGIDAVLAYGDLSAHTKMITAQTLSTLITSDNQPQILDVRRPSEWEINRIEGSINMPLNHMKQGLDNIEHDKKVVVYCASGYRSSIAVSLLEMNDFSNTYNLVGGISDWQTTDI